MKKRTGFLLMGLGGLVGGMIGGYLGNKKVNEKEKRLDKFKGYYNVLNQWLMIKQQGKSVADYFKSNNYHEIAIYGMGELGNRLYDELKNTGITVKCAIDKNAENIYSELEVCAIDDELESVDVVVVSAIFAFDEIESELSERMDCPIISLEDVIYEI